MCYVCTKSSKVLHIKQCGHMKNVPKENQVVFNKDDLNDAFLNGYGLCRDCSRIGRKLKKEHRAIDDLCSQNEILYDYNRTEDCLDISSRSGKWKIIIAGKHHVMFLYHRNTHFTSGGIVPGYHSQKVRETTIEGYLQYIVEHDDYRNKNPYGRKRKKFKPMSGKKQRVASKRKRQRIAEQDVRSLISEWEKEEAESEYAY